MVNDLAMRRVLGVMIGVGLFLLTPGMSGAGDRPSQSYPSIHDAAKAGDTNAVRAFLDKGVPPNSKDEEAWTPLHHAALNGRKDVVELLIARGADVNERISSAHRAAGATPLHLAASNDHLDIAEVLIERGADIQAKDDSGETPLHRAARYNSKRVAELLIARGADVNAADNESITPLELALANGQKDVASLLKKNGAQKPQAPRAGRPGPAGAGKTRLPLNNIVLLNPDAQLQERLTDPGALAEYMNSLMETAGEALAGGPYADARGIVIGVGIKPGRKARIWCDAIEGLIPQEELRKLEAALQKVPGIKVKNGPLMLLLCDDLWRRQDGAIGFPAAWRQAMSESKKREITPDELIKLVWKN